MSRNEFGAYLRETFSAKGLSVGDIALRTGIDRTYLYRLTVQESDWLNQPLTGGPIKQPSRDLILRLAFGLGLTLDETDELLFQAGYAPLTPPPVPARHGQRRTERGPR